ncbi:MAG: pectate lyase [Prevotella sp.]|nr:pectate lyase [Prevotella sp.]
MRKLFTTIALAASTIVAMAQTPAFPGAEGHGRYVTGGRGGKIIHVTNLNDSGTGSLRAALGTSGKRIIVFDVAGYIDLKSNLSISKGDVTILGQTAPGEGITLRHYTLELKADNVIIRYIRSRRGNEKDVDDGADAFWGRQHNNVIIDHCSFSWSIDEVASFYDNRNFTMQWCTIGEALTNAGHGKGAHGFGGIWGGKDASFHHNMLIHLNNRTPRFNGARYNWSGYDKSLYSNALQAERVDFRNCVVYNWGSGGCYGGPGGGYVNMVNNYYKAGPATSKKTRVTQVSIASSGNSTSDNPFPGYSSRYYISGNYVTAGETPENYDWQGVDYDDGFHTINNEKYMADASHNYGENVTYVKNSSGVDCISVKLDEAIDAGEVTTHKAEMAFDKVLAYAGASLGRDAVDARYAEEAKNGTATYKGSVTNTSGIIDTQNDVGGWPELNEGTPITDTDKDGMPDAWETANGLNPNDASDASTYTLDDKKQYYTNIEVYANSLVEDMIKAQNDEAISSVDEYYPMYTDESGVVHNDPNMYEYILSGDNYTYKNPKFTYSDNAETSGDESILTTTISANVMPFAQDGYIKYATGKKYTIALPEGLNISQMTISGYGNNTAGNSYLSEVNGTTFSATDYVYTKKNSDGSYTVTDHKFNFSVPKTGSITFTPGGKDAMFIITLKGTLSGALGIENVNGNENAEVVNTLYYNIQGQRIDSSVSEGIIIKVEVLSNGKTRTKKILK